MEKVDFFKVFYVNVDLKELNPYILVILTISEYCIVDEK